MDADEFLEAKPVLKQNEDAQEDTTVSLTQEKSKDKESLKIIDHIVEMKDFENYQPPSTGGIFAGAFTADPRIKIYLMLFSCDIGTRDRKGRIGSQNGPKHFINYLQEYESKLQIDSSKLGLYYIGNLIERHLHRSRFKKMVTNVLEMSNQIYTGIGGSDDFTYYYIKHLLDRIALQKSEESKSLGKTINENVAIVHVDSKIDMLGSKDDITSLNYFKTIYDTISLSKL